MKHFAFLDEPFPTALEPSPVKEEPVKVVLPWCPAPEVDNRNAFQEAFWANQMPFRVEGRSYHPFTLEERE